MAKNGTEFSKYATAFYDIIEGGKCMKAKFVKMLLKIGLSDNGKKIIDGIFYTVTNSRGKDVIEKSQQDRLRNYLRGENDITDIADEIYAALNHENYDDYIKELKDYEDSKLIEFAKSLQLNTDFNNIKAVRQAIAGYYYSIIKNASTEKDETSKKSKDKPKSDEQNLIDSYTIKDDEKKAINNICTAIQVNLRQLQSQVEYISSKQHELGKFTDFEPNKQLKSHLEGEIESKTNKFNETHSDLVSKCADLNSILAPKKNMNKSFAKLISITSFFSSDENKEMSIDRFAGTHVQVNAYDLHTYIKYSLKEIDMQ